ncbi:hypothetical protein EMCRGX_G018691 [Ephydatia muelleri]
MLSELQVILLTATKVGLASFNQLDLGVGSIQLKFTEPVNILSINITQFTLQSASTGGVTLTLMPGSATYDTSVTDKTLVNIKLSMNDLLFIKINGTIGTSTSTTYISIGGLAISDIVGNGFSTIPVTTAVMVNSIIASTAVPTLTGFLLRQKQWFSITIQSEKYHSGSSKTLTSAILHSATNGFVISFSMIPMDFYTIQSTPGLAVSENTTFISMTSSAFSGVNGNPVFTILPTNALPVSCYTADSSPPRITQFILDLNTGVLTLTFSEVVNTSTFDPTQLGIQMSSNGTGSIYRTRWSDYTSIKGMNGLAVSNATTFLTATNDTVFDMIGFPLVAILPTSALMAFNSKLDTTPPHLLNFSMDLNSGLVQLTFDDIIVPGSINFSTITLQNAASAPTAQLTLSGGVLQNVSHVNVITFYLSSADLALLNANSMIARSTASTFISLTTGVVVDASGNLAAAVSQSNALPVGLFILDSTPPLLINFDLNMDTGVLVLQFSKLVNPLSFIASYYTLQGDNSSTPINSVRLSSGSQPSTTSNNATLIIPLSAVDILSIKQNLGVAKNSTSTYLNVQQGAVKDIYNNLLSAVLALKVRTYIPDMHPPVLNSFILNMDTNQLILNISEPVDPRSINITQITITNAASATFSRQLTGGFSATNGTQVIVSLADSDVVGLKLTPGFATSTSNTYLVASAFTLTDTSGNMLVPISPNGALQAASVIVQTSPPVLVSFSYKTAGDRPGIVMLLQFSQVINSTTLNPLAFTLQSVTNNATAGSRAFTLTSGIFTTTLTSVLQFNITDADYAAITAMSPLATNANTTFLSVLGGAIQDILNYSLVAIPTTRALPVTEYFVDIIPPVLQSFILNRNLNVLVITFSKVVKLSSYNASQFMLQSNFNGTAAVYSLTGGSLSIQGVQLTITLSGIDLDGINRYPPLALSLNTTFLSVTQYAIQDTSANRVVPISASNALRASQFTSDMSGPVLTSFVLNIDQQSLLLIFSETINIKTLMLTVLTVQNAASNATQSYTLTGGAYFLQNASYVKINMSKTDFFGLESSSAIGTTVSNTYIFFPSVLVSDIFGNPVVPIGRNSALQASEVSTATVPPMLVQFDCNMNNGTLTLVFDEVVDINTFIAAQLALQNSRLNSISSYTLTTSYTISTMSNVVIVQLSSTDLNAVKLGNICLSQSTCYISFTTGLVMNIYGLSTVGINASMAVAVTSYIRDNTPPELLQFVLFDASSARITLLFSEIVNSSSLNFNGVTLQSFSTNPDNTFTLTGGTYPVANSKNITIFLSMQDAIILKQNRLICAQQGICYISISSSAISDMSGNIVKPTSVGLLVVNFIKDTISPTLQSFNLDMNMGYLNLTFSEIMDARSLQYGKLTIQQTLAPTLARYMLTGGTLLSALFDYRVAILLTQQDFYGIEATTFAKLSTDTFLYIDSSAITDLSPTSKSCY